jgi:single-strand DNA-binding protein
VEKYVHKGDKLYVEGKIQTRDYTDRQGISRKSIDIVVDNMELLSPKPMGQGAEPQPAQPETPAAVAPSENNGDYPF